MYVTSITFYKFGDFLSTIKKIPNAKHVINRLSLSTIEPGAYPEMETAYLIKKAGHRVSFSSPKATTKNPDLLAWINSQKINVETMFMQKPKGGWRGLLPRMKLTEVDRIKRAIDNKSRQLPRNEPGIIVIHNQRIEVKELEVAMHPIHERLSSYPNIKALIIVKEKRATLPVEFSEKSKETDEFLFDCVHLNEFTRYTFLLKSKDLQPHLLEAIKKIFIALPHELLTSEPLDLTLLI